MEVANRIHIEHLLVMCNNTKPDAKTIAMTLQQHSDNGDNDNVTTLFSDHPNQYNAKKAIKIIIS